MRTSASFILHASSWHHLILILINVSLYADDGLIYVPNQYSGSFFKNEMDSVCSKPKKEIIFWTVISSFTSICVSLLSKMVFRLLSNDKVYIYKSVISNRNLLKGKTPVNYDFVVKHWLLEYKIIYKIIKSYIFVVKSQLLQNQGKNMLKVVTYVHIFWFYEKNLFTSQKLSIL